MKLAILLACACLLTGCSTTVYNGAGQRLVHIEGDSTKILYKNGDVTFYAEGLKHSTPTRTALLGANKIVGTVASAAVATLVPGGGTTAVVSKTAISAIPHITSPTPANQ